MGTFRTSPCNGCWMDLHDAENHRGGACRLHGPADFPGLRIATGSAAQRIESIRVGPAAYVQCFRLANFEETVIWLLPNQAVESVRTLHFDGELDSVRLYDRPPFAHESGYAAYMLWAASHVARTLNKQE